MLCFSQQPNGFTITNNHIYHNNQPINIPVPWMVWVWKVIFFGCIPSMILSSVVFFVVFEGRQGDLGENMGESFPVFFWLSGICYFHPYLGKIPILTNIFRLVETTNESTNSDHFRNLGKNVFPQGVAEDVVLGVGESVDAWRFAAKS